MTWHLLTAMNYLVMILSHYWIIVGLIMTLTTNEITNTKRFELLVRFNLLTLFSCGMIYSRDDLFMKRFIRAMTYLWDDLLRWWPNYEMTYITSLFDDVRDADQRPFVFVDAAVELLDDLVFELRHEVLALVEPLRLRRVDAEVLTSIWSVVVVERQSSWRHSKSAHKCCSSQGVCSF